MTDILKRNNVTIKGRGSRPMVFAHGFIGDQTLWRLVAAGFEDNYKLVLFDYVGSGQSDKHAYDKQKYSHLEGYAQDVIEVCKALDLTDVIFVGHSISCMIGLIAAMQDPHVFSKMIFVAPSPRYINDTNYYGGFEREDIDGMLTKIEHDFGNWAKEIAPVVVNKPDDPELAEELISKLMTTEHQVALNFARTTFFSEYRKDLLNFKIPSLILQCHEDIMAPLEVGDYLQAHLYNCTLKRLNATGHFPQLSAPQEVIKSIRLYLE